MRGLGLESRDGQVFQCIIQFCSKNLPTFKPLNVVKTDTESTLLYCTQAHM